MSIRSKLTDHLGQLLTATALTTASFHLLFARRHAAAERARYAARITILESIILRLQAGDQIQDAELNKLIMLSRKVQGENNDEDDLGDSQVRGGSISWKEVILGRSS
ncbi:hypothetical protein BU17DRAFT_83490 [Hysterangium stoloniferum]|nr:hypothetical protein BU17DRAFT_83490 [Hysterangium stoloniferum]